MYESTPLCTLDDLQDYLHPAFLAACEAQNPGLAGRKIAAASGEIRDLLKARYPLPWPEIPAILGHIAAVFAAYRTAGAITTLVNSEGQTENEWIPLQTEYKRADALLKDIASGKLKLPLSAVPDENGLEDPAVAVVTPAPIFNLDGF
jgi:phage gp36-like protein